MRTYIVRFCEARNGGPMTKIESTVSFPDRRGQQPKIGEVWEVEISGQNHRGTVKFLRLVRPAEVFGVHLLDGAFSGSTGRLRPVGKAVEKNGWAYQAHVHFSGRVKPRRFGQTLARKVVNGKLVVISTGKAVYNTTSREVFLEGVGMAESQYERKLADLSAKECRESLLAQHEGELADLKESLRSNGWRIYSVVFRKGRVGFDIYHPEARSPRAETANVLLGDEVPKMMLYGDYRAWWEAKMFGH